MIEEEDNFDGPLPTTASMRCVRLSRKQRTEGRSLRTTPPDPYSGGDDGAPECSSARIGVRAERSRRASRVGADAGYSVVEAVIAIPAAVLMFLVAVQLTLDWHARHVAEAAAQDALRAARGFGATSAVGQAAGASYLQQVAPRLLTQTTIAVTRTPLTATVTVRGRVLAIIPLVTSTVDETASGPVERFSSTPAGAAGG